MPVVKKSQIPEPAVVDPKEIAKAENSIRGKDQTPTILEQTGTFVDWKTIQDQLGQPFDVERIPISRLRQMRRDSMIAFGLHYRKVPLVRAKWHVEARDKNGPNAQIAAFFDSAWRKVHAQFVFQTTTDLEFGFAALAKRFQLANPGGVYEDKTGGNTTGSPLKPVWDQGTIEPITWRPFIGLAPEKVQPLFKPTGEFDGILYTGTPAQGGAAGGRAKQGKTNNEINIDIYHALWTTNDKPSVHGNIFGYPLIAHAYRYWWSYWFRWAMADRAYERFAVPPLVARHPPGSYTDPDAPGEPPVPNWQIALTAAESLRSNSIAAVPSTLATTGGLDEKATNVPEWSFEFLETKSNPSDLFDSSFNYLDVMKLRSIFVPEQAFIEGDGGSSSRNVAAQMGEIFVASQANKWEEISDHINRYIFPQLLAINFPEFVANGGTVKIVGHGFASEDTDLLKQLVQLIGQADPKSLGVDIREALSKLNVPLLSLDALQTEEEELIAREAAALAPVVPGVTTTIANPNVNTGFTNGGSVPAPNAPGASVTGFSDEIVVYVQPNEYIELSDNDDFLAALPSSGHYDDKTMRVLAVQMRKVWQKHMKALYPDFANYVKTAKLELSDDDGSVIELADKKITKAQATKLANKLLKDWAASTPALAAITTSSKAILNRMMKRAVAINKKKTKSKADIAEEKYADFISAQAGKLVKSVHGTARDDLKTMLVTSLMTGKTQEEISAAIKDHFKDVPTWKADSIARSETRDAYNEATIIVSEESDLGYLRMKDAQKGPTDVGCELRDGKLVTPKEARKQAASPETHTNCTLEFEPVANADFSVRAVESLPDNAPEDAEAWFDESTCTAYLPIELSDDDTDMFLGAVVDMVNS